MEGVVRIRKKRRNERAVLRGLVHLGQGWLCAACQPRFSLCAVNHTSLAAVERGHHDVMMGPSGNVVQHRADGRARSTVARSTPR